MTEGPQSQNPDIRHVRMWKDLWDVPGISLRAANGQAITIDWGEPDADGFWEPVFTLSGSTEAERVAAARKEIAERVGRIPLMDWGADTMAAAAESMRDRAVAAILEADE